MTDTQAVDNEAPLPPEAPDKAACKDIVAEIREVLREIDQIESDLMRQNPCGRRH